MKVKGINSVMEALKTGRVNKIFVFKEYKNPRIGEIISFAKKKKVPIIYTPELPKDSRGIMAEVSPIEYRDLNKIMEKCIKEGSFILFLDSIEDPQNMGAIIRSAEFFGCAGIVIPKRRCVQVNETVAKVSAGAVFHLEIARVENLANTLKKVKKFGINVIGVDLDGEPLKNIDLSPPLALVVGGEDRGISKPVKKQCDFVAKIEGYGNVNSLNLSVAGAIIMYEFRRRLYEG